MSEIYSEVLMSIPSDFTPANVHKAPDWMNTDSINNDTQGKNDGWTEAHNVALQENVSALPENLRLERERSLTEQTGFSLRAA